MRLSRPNARSVALDTLRLPWVRLLATHAHLESTISTMKLMPLHTTNLAQIVKRLTKLSPPLSRVNTKLNLAKIAVTIV